MGSHDYGGNLQGVYQTMELDAQFSARMRSLSEDMLGTSLKKNYENNRKSSIYAKVSGLLMFSFACIIAIGHSDYLAYLIRRSSGGGVIPLPTETMGNFAGFHEDACKGTMFRARTDCCADPRFPVLGGIDVVALRSISKGNPPVLGKMEWAAALPTSEASYVFLFYSKENRDLFLGDPWFYAPAWGGFDGWEISNNDILKGDSAKKSLGMNTDAAVWLETMENRLLMFGGHEQRESFVEDVDHNTKQGDYKWKQWWGRAEGGVFNTRCFHGTPFSELEDATAQYASGALTFIGDGFGYSGGASTYLKSFDRKALRRAVARGQLYYVHYGERRLERARVEDGEAGGEGFAVDILVEGLPGPKDLRLDVEQGQMYWTDMEDHTVRRCGMDGAPGPEATDLVVSGVTKPALLQLDLASRWMYFTSMQCMECEQYYIQAAPMDLPEGVSPEETASVLVEVTGQSRGLALSDPDGPVPNPTSRVLYYTDYYEGTLRALPVPTGEGSGVVPLPGVERIAAGEILLSGLESATYVYATATDLFWVEGKGKVIKCAPLSEDGSVFGVDLDAEAAGVVTFDMDGHHPADEEEGRALAPGADLMALQVSEASAVFGAGRPKAKAVGGVCPAARTVLLAGLAQVDDLEVREGLLFWSAKEGYVASAPLATLLARAAVVDKQQLQEAGERGAGPWVFSKTGAAFTVVLDGLKTPKGMDLQFWPCPKGLDFTMSTKYTERGDNYVYSDYPWATGPVVELHQPTTLRVVAPDLEGHEYEFLYRGRVYATPALQLTLREVGEVPLVLRERARATGRVTRELRTALHGKYVRREIRRLLDEDRARFFAALEAMVKTPLEEGRARYGPAWQNNEYFVHMHNVLAGARDCDHLHSGSGFLFNHVGLTNEFEQNLQLVDPAVTVPFWDFTIDGHAIYSLHGGDFDALWNSVIFDPQWFGDARNEHFTVTEGRWAWALKIADEQWDNQVHNSYGLMRAPWNNNNFPFVQRFPSLAGVPLWNIKDGWPVCEYHFDVVKKHRTWLDFANNIAGEPHGSVHGILGGSMNYNEAYDALEDKGLLPKETVARIREKTYKSTKALWRTGLRPCPEYCPLEAPMDECKCTCGADIWERLDDPDVLQQYIGATLFGVGTEDLDALSYDQKKEVIVTLCDQVTVIGDGLESASPADPIFWPIHPTVERLFVWKMLNGGLDEYEWAEDNIIPAGMDHTCYLHGPNDRMPWKLMMDTGSKRVQKTYSNKEMFSATNPIGDFKMPYVYDNFEWPHCIDEGFDFNRI